MVDERRQAVAKDALSRLAERSFRQKLTAVAPDGSRPVIPALLEDRFYEVVEQVHRSGGVGNVVVPFAAGLIILALHTSHVSNDESIDYPMLSPEVTVGVVIARFLQDAPAGESLGYLMPYACAQCDDDGAELASTELVGMAE
jgi:hypothetical protein